ncbi:MAG: transcriptional regulator NrdR [Phycisphaerae bacterium]
MRCPYCKANNDKVVDSRAADGASAIRRRRECLECSRRFTTYERPEEAVKLSVIKRDGTRMPYDRERITESVRRASYKRPITGEQILQITDEVEEHLITRYDKEVSSQTIGERVSTVLRRVDQVAYVRFASVYRQFEDVGDFIEEAREVIERQADEIPGQQSLFEETEES